MNKHKQAMYDDLFFSVALVVIGVVALEHSESMGWVAFVFGALWLSVRLYHLFNQGKVFGED